MLGEDIDAGCAEKGSVCEDVVDSTVRCSKPEKRSAGNGKDPLQNTAPDVCQDHRGSTATAFRAEHMACRGAAKSTLTCGSHGAGLTLVLNIAMLEMQKRTECSACRSAELPTLS